MRKIKDPKLRGIRPFRKWNKVNREDLTCFKECKELDLPYCPGLTVSVGFMSLNQKEPTEIYFCKLGIFSLTRILFHLKKDYCTTREMLIKHEKQRREENVQPTTIL